MLPFVNVMRCVGEADELLRFWSAVLDDGYDSTTLFRVPDFGVGILTLPQKNNAIEFDTEKEYLEGFEHLSKSYPNIRFEWSNYEMETGVVGVYILHDGKKYDYKDSGSALYSECSADSDDHYAILRNFLDWASKNYGEATH